jgi:hypothetical protein
MGTIMHETTDRHPTWCTSHVTFPNGVVEHRRKWLVYRAWWAFGGRWEELNVELLQDEGGAHAALGARVHYNLGGADAETCRKVAGILLEAADMMDGATAEVGA